MKKIHKYLEFINEGNKIPTHMQTLKIEMSDSIIKLQNKFMEIYKDAEQALVDIDLDNHYGKINADLVYYKDGEYSDLVSYRSINFYGEETPIYLKYNSGYWINLPIETEGRTNSKEKVKIIAEAHREYDNMIEYLKSMVDDVDIIRESFDIVGTQIQIKVVVVFKENIRKELEDIIFNENLVFKSFLEEIEELYESYGVHNPTIDCNWDAKFSDTKGFGDDWVHVGLFLEDEIIVIGDLELAKGFYIIDSGEFKRSVTEYLRDERSGKLDEFEDEKLGD